MQIAVYLKHDRAAPSWGQPHYIRRITMRGRPQIITAPEPIEADPSATVEALDAVLAELVALSNGFCSYRIEARGFVHISEG